MTEEEYLALILYDELRNHLNKTDKTFYLNIIRKLKEASDKFNKGNEK